MTTTTKYHLPDVSGDLRARVLDLCTRRLYHEALELLQANGFYHYNRDDLINFYHWAPATLPSQTPPEDPHPQTPRDYPQPSPALIADLRTRLVDVPSDVLERVDHTLKHDRIDHAASLLWKAGAGFTSAELYEYRKTLFPPNSMTDPYTSGPPVLRPTEPTADSLSAAAVSTTPSPESSVSDQPSIPESISPISPIGPIGPILPSPNPEPPPPLPPAPSIQSSHLPAIPVATPPLLPARKRHGKSKIASLPKDIRDELNQRLESNQSYTTIMRWLAGKGQPGFNKQNLHKWKEGGFQDWRRENERLQTQLIQREWLNDQIAQTKPGELFVLIDQLFVTQLLDSLFGLDTAVLKQGLQASPRHYVSLFSAYNRFKREAMNSDEFRAFLQRQTERKNSGKPCLSDEGLGIMEDALHLM